MSRIGWIVGCIAIILGLGATFVPLAARSSGYAQEQQQLAPPPEQAAVKPAPPTPIAEKKAELGDDQTWDPHWDIEVEKALPADLLSPQVAKAVKPLCPRFSVLSEADKRAYWAYFFQALAGAEAGLVPTKNVRHTDPELAVVDDVTHRMIRQE